MKTIKIYTYHCRFDRYRRCLVFFYWMRTPQYTFTQIHEAVQQHDLTKFEKHVDLNSLYAHAYDDVVYYAFGDPKEANPFYSVSFKA